MLAPDDRQLLVESLAPPVGSVLDAAVATTFTLDLEALLVPALAFSAGSVAGVIGDPLATLEALRRTSDRIDVFAQAGAIAVPSTAHDLFAFLEPIVHAVEKPRHGLFHPKLWLVRYREENSGELSYRLLVLSRNLTLDNSWDVVVRLDSASLASRIQAENQPLHDFVVALCDRCAHPIDAARRARIDLLAKEIRRVVWELPDGVNGLAFHYVNGSGRLNIDLEGRRHLVVAPFVNDAGIGMFASSPDLAVISRAEELEKLGPDVAQALTSFVLDVPQTDDAEAAERTLLGHLHAKAYVIEPWGRAQRARLLLGSANATDIAFRHNIEFLVEFEGRRRDLGVEALIGVEAPFRQMVTEYLASGGATPTPTEELQRAMENALRRVAEIPHTVEVVAGNGGQHTVRLRAETRYAVDDDWDVSVELLSRPAQAVRPDTTLPLDVRIDDVSTTEVTPFVSIRLSAPGVTVSAVVVAEIVNDPPERLDEVLAAQFDDPRKFERFLLMMLSPQLFALAADGAAGQGKGAGEGAPASPSDPALLDLFLNRIGTGDAALRDLASLVERLRATEGGMKAFPDGFLDLWDEIEKANTMLNGASR